MEPNTTNQNPQPSQPANMPKKSGMSKAGIWIGVLIIIVLGVAIIYFNKEKREAMTPTPEETTSADGTDETPTTGTTPAASLSYQQALMKYKGKIIQFTADCQATPDRQTFKQGTSIMLDNRSAAAKTVKIGSTYTLGKYGFRIITLNTVGTFLVDCGTSQNVSTVIVQK